MHNYFRQLKGFYLAAFKYLLRSPSAIFFGFFLPLIIIVSLGYSNNSEIQYQVGYIKNSDSEYQEFVKVLDSQNILELKSGTRSELSDDLKASDVDAYISFNEEAKALTVNTNNGRPEEGSNIIQTIDNLNKTFQLEKQGLSQNFEIIQKSSVGRSDKYIDFLLPGVIGFSLLSSAVAGASFTFLSMRKTYTLKRLFAAPTLVGPFILGHSLARLILAVMQSLFLIAVSVWLVDYTIRDGIWGLVNMMIVIIFGLISFLGLGYVVAGIAKSEDQAAPLTNLIILPQFILAGTFFTVSSLPSWLENIANKLPLYYFNEALRLISLDGQTIYSIPVIQNLLGLAIWSVIIYAISFKVFNLKEK